MGSNEICTIARHSLINSCLKEKKTLRYKHAKRFSSKEIRDVVMRCASFYYILGVQALVRRFIENSYKN